MLYEEFVTVNKTAFLEKVRYISSLLKCNPDDLMLVMYAESRLKSAARNALTDASGLIQFIPSTANWLGTTTAALRAMSNVQQLDYVYKYFKSLGATGKVKNVFDLYILTFFPIALGKPDSWVLQSSDLTAYKIASQNKIIDINRDGQITVGEFKQYVATYLKKKTLLSTLASA